MKKIIYYFRWLYYKLFQYYKLGILCFFVRDIIRRIFMKFRRRFSRCSPGKVIDTGSILKIKINSLYKYEKRIYSQNDEDGITLHVLSIIPHKKYFVEFGVGDGSECNCRILKENGYAGIVMDMYGDGKKVFREYITSKNINSVFQKYSIPKDGGILSIDIDSKDFWAWKSLSNDYKFDLVIVEYNSILGYKESKVIPYENSLEWDGTDYFGASIKAFETLGKEKGYMLIYADITGTNLYFLYNKHRKFIDREMTIKNFYKPPCYGITHTGHPHDLLERKYITY